MNKRTGNYRRGAGHGRAKVSEKDRETIRLLMSRPDLMKQQGVSVQDLADTYKVHWTTIYRIADSEPQEDSLSGAGETLDNGISVVPADEVQRILNGC